ncbi:hypothetical protein [Maridesulfovibrio sp. FT414]|uniref:hypothetical protein n=1 Tax=Maridesulfovibrio sp. FT414 TaxID=2979469 RepID=UPI003D805337
MATIARRRIMAVMYVLGVCSLFLLQGCPIAVVAIIAAYSSNGDVTVTVEVPRNAEIVFEAAKRRVSKGVSETGIPYKITKINDANYTVSLEGSDGSWRGDFIVVPLSDDRSQIIGQGTDDNRTRKESEHLILLGIENLCKDLGVKYTVIERNLDS